MIKAIAKLFKALNANVNPGEIAHAFSCGILLGLMPKNNVFWYLLFIFILFIFFCYLYLDFFIYSF